MTTIIANFFRFYLRKIKLAVFLCLAIVCALPCLCACEKDVDYFEDVSELRLNILLGETDGLSARIYAVEKEHPYVADGTKRNVSKRTEIYLSAPSGDKEYILSFSIDGQPYSGDAVYDNVKAEYYFSCEADSSNLNTLSILIEYDDTKVELNATSVRTEHTLSPNDALKKLCDENKDLFTGLTDKYGFAGEIYIRLIYEDAAYYYFGIIEKSGKITAFLMNAENGKILAKRES